MKIKLKELILYPIIIIALIYLILDINIDILFDSTWYKKLAKKYPESKLLHLIDIWCK